MAPVICDLASIQVITVVVSDTDVAASGASGPGGSYVHGKHWQHCIEHFMHWQQAFHSYFPKFSIYFITPSQPHRDFQATVVLQPCHGHGDSHLQVWDATRTPSRISSKSRH